MAVIEISNNYQQELSEIKKMIQELNAPKKPEISNTTNEKNTIEFTNLIQEIQQQNSNLATKIESIQKTIEKPLSVKKKLAQSDDKY